MILYINSCVRENSRTDALARRLLDKLGGDYEELYLPGEDLRPLDRETLDRRTAFCRDGIFEDPMFDYAKQLAAADTIVIAAPCWDLSFPAVLKLYIENIYVTGLVTKFDDEGHSVGLCRADKLYYVTTGGGRIDPVYGYEYLRDMFVNLFGVRDAELLAVAMLDIAGNDPEAILAERRRDFGLD